MEVLWQGAVGRNNSRKRLSSLMDQVTIVHEDEPYKPGCHLSVIFVDEGKKCLNWWEPCQCDETGVHQVDLRDKLSLPASTHTQSSNAWWWVYRRVHLKARGVETLPA